jgi:hypothetical protein
VENRSSKDLMILYPSSGEDVRYLNGVVDVWNIPCLLTPLILMLLGGEH